MLDARWLPSDRMGRGLLQGCPFSPLIACTVMSVWTANVAPQGGAADAAVYLDDRTLWLRSEARSDTPQEAMRQSDAFDRAFGLECRIDKCHVAAASPEVARRFGRDRLGYEVSATLSALGLSFDLAGIQRPSLRKFDIQVAAARLRRCIRVAAPSHAHKKLLVTSLVLPMFCWAGGFARLGHELLTSLRGNVLAAWGRSPCDAPRCILFGLFGWQCDPVLMSSWSAFRHAIRFHACPPAWTEECDVITALQPWHSLMPAAREALQIEGWSWTQDGACITRLDEEGRTRTFRVGVDRPAVLFDWLVVAHRKRLFHNCGRIAKSLHRSDSTRSLGPGPDLPAPQPNMVPLYRGHQACWQAAGTDRDVRKAAMAAGLSVWHEHAGIQLCEGDPRRVCKCKKLLPSRPHLMWSCPAFTVHRQEVSQPIDRAQARLYQLRCHQCLPHPWTMLKLPHGSSRPWRRACSLDLSRSL